MAKADVAVPVNINILNRRKSSLTDHVNRIRSAYSSHQSVQWWKNTEKKVLPNSNFHNRRNSSPESRIFVRGKYHNSCLPEYSLEDLDEAEMLQRNLENIQDISDGSKTSLDSAKLRNRTNVNGLEDKTRTKTSILKRASNREQYGKEHLEKSRSGTSARRAPKNAKYREKHDKVETKHENSSFEISQSETSQEEAPRSSKYPEKHDKVETKYENSSFERSQSDTSQEGSSKSSKYPKKHDEVETKHENSSFERSLSETSQEEEPRSSKYPEKHDEVDRKYENSSFERSQSEKSQERASRSAKYPEKHDKVETKHENSSFERPQSETLQEGAPRSSTLLNNKYKAKQEQVLLERSQSETLSGRTRKSTQKLNRNNFQVKPKQIKENSEKSQKEISSPNTRKKTVKSNKTRSKTTETQTVSKVKKKSKAIKKPKMETDKKDEKNSSYRDEGKDEGKDEDETDIEYDFEKMPLDKINTLNANKPLSSRDTIVLTWFHSLSCPLSDKKNAEENKLDSLEKNRIPVRILKKPLNSNARKKSRVSLNNKDSSDDFEETSDISYKTNKKVNKTEIKQNTKHRAKKLSRSVNPSLNNTNELLKQCTVLENEVSDEDVTVDSKQAQIYASELGKIQIILDSKLLCPEDSAIIIWLDDLTQTVLAPDFRRRLSISSLKDLKSPDASGNVFQSHSASRLEDMPSPRPNIYYPSVTMLKNIAIDSKGEMKNLGEDFSNSVFYKRCNLNHIDLE